ncbi:MAG TPA: HEAT repeat domain-containing protein [Myxococcota bacterium]|jgi:HEAT repeat protein|nr:HEAT repeat domain-containing protein [Myxococcota bacterium]
MSGFALTRGVTLLAVGAALAGCGADLSTLDGALDGIEERGKRAEAIEAVLAHIGEIRDVHKKEAATERAADALIKAYDTNDGRPGVLKAVRALRKPYEEARPLDTTNAYGKKMAPLLAKVADDYLPGKNDELVVEACALAGELRAVDAVKSLGSLLERAADPRIKVAVALALGGMKNRAALDPLTNALLSHMPKEELEVKRVIIESLGASGMPEAAPVLVAGLYMEDGDVSFFPYVQPALLQLGAKNAIPALISVLEGKNKMVDYVNEDLEPGIREFKAAWVLGDFYTKRTKAIDVLSDMLKDDKGNPSPRTSAAVPLGKIGGDRAREALLKYVDEGHWLDRKTIIEGLYYLNDPKALPKLLEIAGPKGVTTTNGIKHHRLRWAAARGVELVGDVAALDAFRALLDAETDEETKGVFNSYLSGFQTVEKCKADVGCWEDLLEDDSTKVVEKAAWMIAQLGDSSSVAELIAALGKPMPMVGEGADRKPDPRGRFAILYALNRLRPKGIDISPMAAAIAKRDGSEVPRLLAFMAVTYYNMKRHGAKGPDVKLTL